MSNKPEIPYQLRNLIKAFKTALKKYFNNFERKRSLKDTEVINYYEEAKKAET